MFTHRENVLKRTATYIILFYFLLQYSTPKRIKLQIAKSEKKVLPPPPCQILATPLKSVYKQY